MTASGPDAFAQVVSFLSFAAVAAALLFVWRQSLPGRLRLFTAQSVLLAGLAGAVAAFTGKRELWLVALAVLGVKAWLVPRVLRRVAPALPRPSGRVPSPVALLLGAGALIVVAYAVMLPVAAGSRLPTAGSLPLGLAVSLLGLLVCVSARRALTQILGFLVFENGVFMLALLATYGLPGVVEIGVFLDLLVAVLIATAVLGEIEVSFASTDIDRLRELRG
jgi:hydrogenase-4 component E